MKNLNVICLGYNTPVMIRRALEQFEEQKPDYPIKQKVFVDARYPIVQDSTVASQYLMALCKQFGWEYTRPLRNLGVAGNWNWAIKEMGLKDGDVLWGVDPDGNPTREKYLDGAMDVFNHAPECVTVQMNDVGVYKMAHIPRDEKVVGFTCVVDYHQLTAWPLGGFDIGWVERIGGFLQKHPLYGYIEHAMSEKFLPLGGKVYMLRDFADEHIKATDALYTVWKQACANHQTQLPLDQWIKIYGA